MINGLRTAAYPVSDLSAAKERYRQVLAIDPYFDEPFYVGFEVGGFELGLVPDGERERQACKRCGVSQTSNPNSPDCLAWGAESLNLSRSGRRDQGCECP